MGTRRTAVLVQGRISNTSTCTYSCIGTKFSSKTQRQAPNPFAASAWCLLASGGWCMAGPAMAHRGSGPSFPPGCLLLAGSQPGGPSQPAGRSLPAQQHSSSQQRPAARPRRSQPAGARRHSQAPPAGRCIRQSLAATVPYAATVSPRKYVGTRAYQLPGYRLCSLPQGSFNGWTEVDQ